MQTFIIKHSFKLFFVAVALFVVGSFCQAQCQNGQCAARSAPTFYESIGAVAIAETYTIMPETPIYQHHESTTYAAGCAGAWSGYAASCAGVSAGGCAGQHMGLTKHRERHVSRSLFGRRGLRSRLGCGQ